MGHGDFHYYYSLYKRGIFIQTSADIIFIWTFLMVSSLLYCTLEACAVMAVVLGNGLDELSSNSGWNYCHFTWHWEAWIYLFLTLSYGKKQKTEDMLKSITTKALFNKEEVKSDIHLLVRLQFWTSQRMRSHFFVTITLSLTLLKSNRTFYLLI